MCGKIEVYRLELRKQVYELGTFCLLGMMGWWIFLGGLLRSIISWFMFYERLFWLWSWVMLLVVYKRGMRSCSWVWQVVFVFPHHQQANTFFPEGVCPQHSCRARRAKPSEHLLKIWYSHPIHRAHMCGGCLFKTCYFWRYFMVWWGYVSSHFHSWQPPTKQYNPFPVT